jgi:hypothetical protein
MPYDATDYITASLNGEDLKSQYSPIQDFQPLPTYSQSIAKNETWVVVTQTKTESDGTRTQTSSIVSKR